MERQTSFCSFYRIFSFNMIKNLLNATAFFCQSTKDIKLICSIRFKQIVQVTFSTARRNRIIKSFSGPNLFFVFLTIKNDIQWASTLYFCRIILPHLILRNNRHFPTIHFIILLRFFLQVYTLLK